tara:strand:- start:3297 stop:3617 length:321 start_codon:yes stop_codon:yes gene_type:complete
MFDPTEIYQRLINAGGEWADAHAAAEILADAADATLAKEFINAQGAVEHRKALAKTSAAFQEAQAQATTARLEANKAKIKYDSMKAWTDLVRTSEATRRAEIDKGL